jgi:hypothetical protein
VSLGADYRRKNKLPSYAEQKGITKREPKTADEHAIRVKELEKALKKRAVRRKGKSRNPKKIPAHLHATTRMKCESIHINRSEFSVRKMCKVLKIKESIYYRFVKQEDKRNQRRDEENRLVSSILLN